MIGDPQHTIQTLAVHLPTSLALTFADGVMLTVDLAHTIQAHPALAALGNTALFSSAHLDSRGGYVVWLDDELEMAADNLRNLAVEQAGGIGPERLLNWMDRHGLTQVRAADALGLSRRMLNYYLSGAKPIPKIVWLACLGLESDAAHETRFALAG